MVDRMCCIWAHLSLLETGLLMGMEIPTWTMPIPTAKRWTKPAIPIRIPIPNSACQMAKRLKTDFSDGALKLSLFLPWQRDLVLIITLLIRPMRSHFILLGVYPLLHLGATVGVLCHHQCVRGYFLLHPNNLQQ